MRSTHLVGELSCLEEEEILVGNNIHPNKELNLNGRGTTAITGQWSTMAAI